MTFISKISLLRTSQLKNEQIIQVFDHKFEKSILYGMKFGIILEYKQEVRILKFWTLKIFFKIFTLILFQSILEIQTKWPKNWKI